MNFERVNLKSNEGVRCNVTKIVKKSLIKEKKLNKYLKFR